MSCRGCGRVCSCTVTAGSGVQVTGHGTAGSPYVITATGGGGTVDVGCGLSGDGSGGAPLAVAAAAGQEPWPWTCPPAMSTVKCDPGTGQLWAPPEHHALAYQFDHLAITSPEGPFAATGGVVRIAAGVDTIHGFFADEFEPNQCRWYSYEYSMNTRVDVVYSAGASFLIGYIITPPDGGPVTWQPFYGRVDAAAAERQIVHFGISGHFTAVDPTADHLTTHEPGIEVVAGSVTVVSWYDFGGAFATTQMQVL